MNLKPKAKRICQFVAAGIALLMIVCLMLPALYADVIFEPRDNFYEKHREDMEYVDKVYIASASVNGYESPVDDDVLLTASEGQRLYISFAYTDQSGEEWGVYDWDTVTCWFRLSELDPVYDNRNFIADHGHEFTDYADQLSDVPLDGAEMPLWTYPGSPSQSGRVYLDEYFTHSDYAHTVYTDPAGRAWVYIPYFQGMEGWANAADPLNPDPVVFDANAPAETPTPTGTPSPEVTATPEITPEPDHDLPESSLPAEESVNPLRLSNILLIVLAVLAVGFVVVVSAVIIVVLYVLNKKKKK